MRVEIMIEIDKAHEAPYIFLVPRLRHVKDPLDFVFLRCDTITWYFEPEVVYFAGEPAAFAGIYLEAGIH
jgi:hypothetical protein